MGCNIQLVAHRLVLKGLKKWGGGTIYNVKCNLAQNIPTKAGQFAIFLSAQ